MILNAPDGAVLILLQAIREYAFAAYPPGGSECAQVSRVTLTDAAERIETLLRTGAEISCSRRLRSQFRAAVNYYVEQRSISEECTGLLQQLAAGEAIAASSWQDSGCETAGS